MIDLAMLGFWRNEDLEYSNRKLVEHCKWGLMWNSRRGLEDNRAEIKMEYGGPTQEVSEENNISSVFRNDSFDI